MTLVPTLLETLATTALGAGLTWTTSWFNHRRELRRLRIQRSKEKADEVLRAVDNLELVGPVPGPLAGGEGPHAGSGSLPDLTAGRAAVAAVRNSALLIDDQQLRQRIGTALSYMELCTLPGMFDTLRIDIVWPDTCRDIRECVAAYARGDNLPHPPSTYELYDRALAPLEEASKQAMAALRKYAEKVKSERA